MQIVSVNISEQKGTIKHAVPEVTIDLNGIVGDAHAGTTNRLVSLLARETVERFAKGIGREIAFGEFAENLTTRGLDPERVWLLDKLRIGDVELEVTQIGKKCHGNFCAIFREVGRCVMPDEGIFSRVIHGGKVKPGDALQHLPKQLEFKIITLSDRASRGEYEDRSGPRIKELVEEYMQGKRWSSIVDSTIIPDDPEILASELRGACDTGYDVVITTGGTGVGRRDITPDVVEKECSKLIPGIMEHIRAKYGANNPAALLSRSVAGVLGSGLVYTLPGSVKAVEEYMSEILKTLEHLIIMLHGLDFHSHR
ncbi:MAG: MOSC domain-containing protein [Candidatus Latescibacteria bacterium]|nr:MOSC domain-containing protein [Candidatus Latescibacterota bacterium]NIM66324.1 MOSC domain-containing protein [Candidatus Latescibacterota bacterium]NIO02803.1 MOSC domain-containing protein [Candidatus Latescibacterota bacterium]NIO29938.1 MOSC domain-containing protein [Candidatus Latescibacterota bacterium]NIO57553.1 MOSC domain-containing protein [Candidatus Latescibacterota bacterium]